MSWLAHTARAVLRMPILVYRYALSPLLPMACRHLPTCSDYADEAIRLNGGWKGGWLAASRLCRCHPLGSHGFDPVPDLRSVRHPWYTPWRYGRWTGRHIRPALASAQAVDGGEEHNRPAPPV